MEFLSATQLTAKIEVSPTEARLFSIMQVQARKDARDRAARKNKPELVLLNRTRKPIITRRPLILGGR